MSKETFFDPNEVKQSPFSILGKKIGNKIGNKKPLWIALGATFVVLAIVMNSACHCFDKKAGLSSSDSYNGHEYVDLGLPSGTLWATCNVGAGKPEAYGDYFAWGETQTKNTYNGDTYQYCNGTFMISLDVDGPIITKYCNDSKYGFNGFTDNLTTLLPEDDAAVAKWGSGWYTPSKAQWDELLANTTNKWVTQNGVAGRFFTSKKNGQTLFLPAAGFRMDRELYNTGSIGIYWSRSLDTDATYNAWHLYLYSDGCGIICDGRGSGLSVRPVHEK